MTPDEQPIYAALGYRVRRARLNRDMNQGSLAESVGVARSHMCQIEKGQKKVSVAQLFSIADCLAVEPWELLPGFGEVR